MCGKQQSKRTASSILMFHHLLVHCSFSFNKNFVSLAELFFPFLKVFSLLCLCQPPTPNQEIIPTTNNNQNKNGKSVPKLVYYLYTSSMQYEPLISIVFGIFVLHCRCIRIVIFVCFLFFCHFEVRDVRMLYCCTAFFLLSFVTVNANFGQMRMTLFELNCREHNTLCVCIFF